MRAPPPPRIRPGPAAALLLVLVAAGACGGAAGSGRAAGPGTLVLVNATDQGMAPVAVESLFFVPQGSGQTPFDRLAAPVPPGGIVIVGLFPAGLYDAVAVITGGLNVTFNDVEIRAGAPTTLTVP